MMRESWLPARPESATRARAIVREASHQRRLDEDAAWSLMLATTEAVSNAILHGEPCADGDKGILLRVLPWEDGLWVEVCDCGRFEAAGGVPAADEPHGRGILLITAVVDHFELVPDSRFTRLRFGRRRRTLAGALSHAPRRRAAG
jgi:anti-sigma regulatory factor (Ser/Thr protein kinase)